MPVRAASSQTALALLLASAIAPPASAGAPASGLDGGLPAQAEISFRVDEADSTLWFGTGTIALHFDRALRYEAFFCDAGESLSVTLPLASLADSLAPQTINAGPAEIGDFRLGDFDQDVRLDPLADPCFGTGFRLGLRGRSLSRDIEKLLAIDLYREHPDAALFQTRYTQSEAQPFNVTRRRENRLLLDLRRAEPGASPCGFLTLQPTISEWGENWIGVPLAPGFSRSNPLMDGGSYGRGGMPFLDLWSERAGLALASLEPAPAALYFPCLVRPDGRVEIGVEARPFLSHGQFPTTLAPGDTLTGSRVALLLHRGDFYDASFRYGRLLDAALAASGREPLPAAPEEVPASAYLPYWKTWGLGPDFTVPQIYERLDLLADLGFRRVGLDDGWFDVYGRWDPDPAKFPGGAADLCALIADLHQPRWGSAGRDSFEVMLWWNVTGWQAASGLDPALLIQDQSGGYPLDPRGHRYLCPAYAPAVAAILAMVDKMLGAWGADVLYMDDAGLLAAPPCYNPLHAHAYAAQAPEALPDLYRAIRDRVRVHRPQGCLILCECSTPHDPYKRPYYDHEDASDPITDRMVRWKVKFMKAVRGPRAPIGDGYVDPTGGNLLSGTFAHGLGCGAILTSMFESLDLLGEDVWRQWAALYRTKGGERDEVLDLYNLGFDFPEGHALRRDDGSLVFLFTSDAAWSGTVELRGLEAGQAYEVRELDSGKIVGQVAGPAALVDVTMRRQAPGKPYWILLESRPLGATDVAAGQGEDERRAGGGPLSVRVSPVPSTGPVAIRAAWAPAPAAPAASPVISIYDIGGREVRRLVAASSARQVVVATWDGRDREGRRAASGLYFGRVCWGDRVAVARIVLAR